MNAAPPSSTDRTGTSTTSNGAAATATMMSAKHRFEQSIHDYWTKNDDFVPLQDAGMMINQALRSDEENADLYRKIALMSGGSNISTTSSISSTGNISGGGGSISSTASHLYFPYDSTIRSDGMAAEYSQRTSSIGLSSSAQIPPPPEQTLQHIKSIPLPSTLSEKLQKVRIYSTMGLFPSSSRLAYLTVDQQLFVWSYADQVDTNTNIPSMNAPLNTSTSSSILSFAIPSGQSILSVGLVRPKKGTRGNYRTINTGPPRFPTHPLSVFLLLYQMSSNRTWNGASSWRHRTRYYCVPWLVWWSTWTLPPPLPHPTIHCPNAP